MVENSSVTKEVLVIEMSAVSVMVESRRMVVECSSVTKEVSVM